MTRFEGKRYGFTYFGFDVITKNCLLTVSFSMPARYWTDIADWTLEATGESNTY